MENSPGFSPPQHAADASRPSLGFPLGTALLLIIIFSLSGIFSCCYHWDKLRSLRHSFSDSSNAADHPSAAAGDIESPPTKPRPPFSDMKKNQSLSVPVVMPGDEVPKFIALPCPCQPPRPEKLAVEVQNPPPPQVVKPPRLPVPLY